MKKEIILDKLCSFCLKYGESNGYKGHRIIANGYQEPKLVEFFTDSRTNPFTVALSVPSIAGINVKVKEVTNLRIELEANEIIITGGTK